MLRFLLLAVLLTVIARLFWRFVDGLIAGARGEAPRSRSAPAMKLVRDPVCGTYVSARAALSVTAGGATHYFCSEECRNKFGRT